MLSDAKIRSLKPKEKAYKVYDDRGLYMVVNPNGSRWWRFKYKYDGRERGISLGVYPDVTLQYAREQLQEARPLARPAGLESVRAHFVSSILEGKEPIAPGEHGLILMRILDALYASAESGREVRLDRAG